MVFSVMIIDMGALVNLQVESVGCVI